MMELINAKSLCRHIAKKLSKEMVEHGTSSAFRIEGEISSSVLLILSDGSPGTGELGIIFNQRSWLVKQPGDLCFPGGGISCKKDKLIGKFLCLPFLPLGSWPHWKRFRELRKDDSTKLSILLGAAIREGIEEMGINPFALRFLGCLESYALMLFKRRIHPMVVYLNGKQTFSPNWEVEKILKIPVSMLLNPKNYACLHLDMSGSACGTNKIQRLKRPCFVFRNEGIDEILWGATFSITLDFLRIVFGFRLPHEDDLRPVFKKLDGEYMGSTGGTVRKEKRFELLNRIIIAGRNLYD